MFECLDDREGAEDDHNKRTEEPKYEEEDVITPVRGQAPGWSTAWGENTR